MAVTNTLITGPTNGIGRETALVLARKKHRLFLLCRNRAAGEALVDEIKAIDGAHEPRLLIADLGCFDQVKAAAQAFLDTGEPLDVLINNAGVFNLERSVVNGVEEMFAVNHLGHFLLTQYLLPRLRESSAGRIVVVASDAHAFCKKIAFDDLSLTNNFSSLKSYGHSKLANILFTRELVKRMAGSGVVVNCLHPGAIASNLGKNNQRWYGALISMLTRPFFKSTEQGAKTTIYLASQVIESSGKYYVNCKPHKLKRWAEDDIAAERLWQVSEHLLGDYLPVTAEI